MKKVFEVAASVWVGEGLKLSDAPKARVEVEIVDSRVHIRIDSERNGSLRAVAPSKMTFQQGVELALKAADCQDVMYQTIREAGAEIPGRELEP